jgi:hypothetical protein
MIKLFFITLLFKFITNVNNLPLLPKPGSIYAKKITFPFIGHQIVETEIVTDDYAYVKLEGLINNEGHIKYPCVNNSLIFQPCCNLKKIIKKYNIEIIMLHYNVENDSINIIVNIKKIRYKCNIQLDRLNW